MSAAAINMNLAKQYQKKTDKQHILDNPDTYIGSVEKVDSEVWLLNDDNSKIIEKITKEKLKRKIFLVLQLIQLMNIMQSQKLRE